MLGLTAYLLSIRSALKYPPKHAPKSDLTSWALVVCYVHAASTTYTGCSKKQKNIQVMLESGYVPMLWELKPTHAAFFIAYLSTLFTFFVCMSMVVLVVVWGMCDHTSILEKDLPYFEARCRLHRTPLEGSWFPPALKNKIRVGVSQWIFK